MTMLLREKQIKTFQHLIANHRFLDRSHAGTGKTAPQCALTGYLLRTPIAVTVDSLISRFLKSTTSNLLSSILINKKSAVNTSNGKYQSRVIWIQPSSLMNKNRREILDWNPDIHPTEVRVVQGAKSKKDDIIADDKVYVWIMTAEAYKAYAPYLHKTYPDILQIICDEPHLYYRGFKSKRTQAFVQNTPKHCRINFMTATPTPRGKLQSAYIYCHMIQQNYYGSYEFFMNTHADFDEYGAITSWKNHDVLKRFLINYSICWTAKDMYGDIDEFIVRDVLQMHPDVAKIYNTFADVGIAEIKDVVVEAKTGGTNALRIRQMLAHPHILSLPNKWDAQGNPIGFVQTSITDKPTPKLERLLEYADEGEPLIIFGTFTEEINGIAHYLESKGYRVGVIHGQISQNQRNQVDQAFQQGRLDIVVCSALTAGVGFNWGHVNTVIFHSLNYGDDDFLQACARAKRGVRKEPLRIVILEYENSADQLMVWAVHHNSKSSNSANPDNQIIYFPKPTGADDDLLKGLGLELSVGA